MAQLNSAVCVSTAVCDDNDNRVQSSEAGYIPLAGRYVAADGLNLMYSGECVPRLTNLLTLFIHIAREARDGCCFCDASAKRHLENAGRSADIEAYEYLLRTYPQFFVKVAARTSADPLILHVARRNSGIVVSNDMFEWWERSFPFVKSKARVRRVTKYRDHLYFNDQFLFIKDDLKALMRELESLL